MTYWPSPQQYWLDMDSASTAVLIVSDRRRCTLDKEPRGPGSAGQARPSARLRPDQALDRWNLWDRPALFRQLSKEAAMDKEHIKGAADKAKGAVKDAAGKMMDDKGLQAEGKMDKAKGEARQALGDVKDAVRRSTDK
jgi:uncharacterized protein YjbJ (UPF0337 family)